MLSRQHAIAVQAAGRCPGTEVAGAVTGAQEGLPEAIDHLVGVCNWRHVDEKAVGVVEGCEHTAGVTIGVGAVAEARMQKGVVEAPEAVLAVTLLQCEHGPIIARNLFAFECPLPVLGPRYGKIARGDSSSGKLRTRMPRKTR